MQDAGKPSQRGVGSSPNPYRKFTSSRLKARLARLQNSILYARRSRARTLYTSRIASTTGSLSSRLFPGKLFMKQVGRFLPPIMRASGPEAVVLQEYVLVDVERAIEKKLCSTSRNSDLPGAKRRLTSRALLSLRSSPTDWEIQGIGVPVPSLFQGGVDA